MNPSAELLKRKAGLFTGTSVLKETDALDLLGNELPGINPELEKTPKPRSIYCAAGCFADLTKQFVQLGNLAEVKHCFNLAEKMLCNGNGAVRNAISNVYLFSLSQLLDRATPLSAKLKAMLTANLKTEYTKHITASSL